MALATEAAFTANEGGSRNRARSARALAVAAAVPGPTPRVAAIVQICRGAAAFFSARFEEAAVASAAAEEQLREHAPGAVWERTNAHIFGTWAIALRGDLGALEARLGPLIAEAKEQGNLLGAASLSTGFSILLPLAQERLARYTKLALEGFFSETALLALRQELVESQEQAALAAARVLRATEDLARRRATQVLLLAEQRRTWAERSEEAQQSHLLARREWLRLRQLHAGGAVEAPIDGVIEQVSPQLAGNILRAGDRLMAIAPDAARYEIQLRVRNEDFPFVQVGQAVEAESELDHGIQPFLALSQALPAFWMVSSALNGEMPILAWPVRAIASIWA
jgi:hypothetical protein